MVQKPTKGFLPSCFALKTTASDLDLNSKSKKMSRMGGVWNQKWQFVQVFGEDLKEFKVLKIQVVLQRLVSSGF